MGSNLTSLIRNLQQRRQRRRQRLAVAEGVRLVEDAVDAGVTFRGVVVAQGFGDTPRAARLLQSLAARAVPIEDVPERILAQLSDTDTPQGVMAVLEPPSWRWDAIRVAPRAPVLVLDGVQDPGNVGTLLRTALALGAGGALLLRGSADLANPKVIRSGMGATFRLPAALATDEECTAWLERERAEVWAAAAQGTSIGRMARPERLVLILGNEGAGIRPGIEALAGARVAIPLARGAESLNVAVAAGIILHEVLHGH
jgi:TrmH family RNA methyltransferase